MSRRSRAREITLQVLYQSDLNADQPDNIRQLFVAARLNNQRKLVDFANQLLTGVRSNRDEIDQLLKRVAENWSLNRMAAIDRNILRLGAYEIIFSDTPDRVAINEAIELAKRYGGLNSAQFVNGVLDRLIKRHQNSIPELANKPVESVNPRGANAANAADEREFKNPLGRLLTKKNRNQDK